jgi:hypothetical protein
MEKTENEHNNHSHQKKIYKADDNRERDYS